MKLLGKSGVTVKEKMSPRYKLRAILNLKSKEKITDEKFTRELNDILPEIKVKSPKFKNFQNSVGENTLELGFINLIKIGHRCNFNPILKLIDKLDLSSLDQELQSTFLELVINSSKTEGNKKFAANVFHHMIRSGFKLEGVTQKGHELILQSLSQNTALVADFAKKKPASILSICRASAGVVVDTSSEENSSSQEESSDEVVFLTLPSEEFFGSSPQTKSRSNSLLQLDESPSPKNSFKPRANVSNKPLITTLREMVFGKQDKRSVFCEGQGLV